MQERDPTTWTLVQREASRILALELEDDICHSASLWSGVMATTETIMLDKNHR